MQAAARAPGQFHSYIGMAQVTHQIASEQEAHRFMLEAYRAQGDRRMVRRLERSPVTDTIPLPSGYERLRDATVVGWPLGSGLRVHAVLLTDDPAAAEDVEAVARAAEDDAREARASEARLEANFAQLSREGRAAAGRARELRVALRRAD